MNFREHVIKEGIAGPDLSAKWTDEELAIINTIDLTNTNNKHGGIYTSTNEMSSNVNIDTDGKSISLRKERAVFGLVYTLTENVYPTENSTSVLGQNKSQIIKVEKTIEESNPVIVQECVDYIKQGM